MILTERSREREGVVFTKKPIAEFMVKESLFHRLSVDIQSLDESAFNSYWFGYAPGDVGWHLTRTLLSYTYVDPAIGEGVFLHAIIQSLQRLADCYGFTIQDNWWTSHLFGWDIDEEMIEICTAKLGDRFTLYHGDYLENSENVSPEVVIANPPYIRQELLNKSYKKQISDHLKSTRKTLPISTRSDVYVYFLLKVMDQLAPNGVATFIIPNVWMSNDYGNSLRELFRAHAQLLSLTESSTRHFSEDINTIILSAVNRKPTPNQEIQISSGNIKRKYSQRDLVAFRLGWYGSLFLCPDWLMGVIQENPKLSPLGKQLSVSTGMITGNNKKYYSTEPKEGRISAIRTPREITSIVFEKEDANYRIETKNIPFKLRKAPLLWTDLRGHRHVTAHNKDSLPFEHTFYGLTPIEGDERTWAFILNSSWTWLMVEIFGRKGLGGGAIRLVKSDLNYLPMPKGLQMTFPKELDGFLHRPVLNMKEELSKNDRRLVDKIVFKFLGISEKLDTSLDLLNSLMNDREKKAKGN